MEEKKFQKLVCWATMIALDKGYLDPWMLAEHYNCSKQLEYFENGGYRDNEEAYDTFINNLYQRFDADLQKTLGLTEEEFEESRY